MSAEFKNGDKVITVDKYGDDIAGTIVGDGNPIFTYKIELSTGGQTERMERMIRLAAGGRRKTKKSNRRSRKTRRRA